MGESQKIGSDFLLTHSTTDERELQAFNLSIYRALESAPGAEAVLAVLAFMAPDHIPAELLHEGFIGFIERSDAIAALLENSLIAIEEEQDGTTYLHMRRHVQQLMHDRLQNCGAATEAAAVATLLLASAFSCQDDSPPML